MSDQDAVRMYQGTHEDGLLMLKWYNELVVTGDLEKLLFPGSHPLGAFINMFESGSNKLFWVKDSDGVWLAAWFNMVTNRMAYMSLWVRKDKRANRNAALKVYGIYENAFQVVGVLFGVTKQEKLLKVHERIGYKVLCKVEKLWGGIEDAWVVMLTKEGFEGGRW